jgi:hypothetical protein
MLNLFKKFVFSRFCETKPIIFLNFPSHPFNYHKLACSKKTKNQPFVEQVPYNLLHIVVVIHCVLFKMVQMMFSTNLTNIDDNQVEQC